ncbi:hypothetical protein CNY89_30445, partial [Amaricoccus sp. HAR-UPW-R2A-40]
RSKTVDEEISAKVVDFLDRNDPEKTDKPFFVWSQSRRTRAPAEAAAWRTLRSIAWLTSRVMASARARP